MRTGMLQVKENAAGNTNFIRGIKVKVDLGCNSNGCSKMNDSLTARTPGREATQGFAIVPSLRFLAPLRLSYIWINYPVKNVTGSRYP